MVFRVSDSGFRVWGFGFSPDREKSQKGQKGQETGVGEGAVGGVEPAQDVPRDQTSPGIDETSLGTDQTSLGIDQTSLTVGPYRRPSVGT